ncbi:MAG: FG-GAP-like repeat-containing protein, partial [Phycisphaerales bacterium]|nr:FG-GAP-like repeat-containing protein [Phycisphaerales bacterium]
SSDIAMYGSTWFNEFIVRLPTRFSLNDQSVTFGDTWSGRDAFAVFATAPAESAICMIEGPGTLDLESTARIGYTDRRGKLEITNNSRMVVDGNLHIESSGSILVDLNQTSAPVIARGGSIIGSLGVANPDGMSISEGDSFTLLRFTPSSPPQGQDAFGAALLPDIGDDLVLQLQYDGGVTAGYLDVQVTATAQTLPDFDDPASIYESGTAIDVVTVDFDLDGKDEICVLFDTGQGPAAINVYDGTDLALLAELDAGYDARDLAVGDFNGDGSPDLAVANFGDGNVGLFFSDTNTGLGFNADWAYPSEGRPMCVTRADWSTDTAHELIVGLLVPDANGKAAPTGAFEVFIWSGNLLGGGMSGGGSSGSPGGVPSVFGDPSEDEGQKDMPVSGGDDRGNAMVLKGASGVAGATLDIQLIPLGVNASSLTIADIDNDGILDLVAAMSDLNAIAIAKGTDSGNISTAVVSMPAGGGAPASVTAADFDNDGQIDLGWIVDNEQGERTVQLAYGLGNSTFTALETIADRTSLLTTGDLTGSGLPDLVTIEQIAGVAGNALVLSTADQSSGTQDGCPGDTDDSGVVNIDDLLTVIGQFGNDCNGGCTGDTNDDGVVNIDDVLQVISAFGPC